MTNVKRDCHHRIPIIFSGLRIQTHCFGLQSKNSSLLVLLDISVMYNYTITCTFFHAARAKEMKKCRCIPYGGGFMFCGLRSVVPSVSSSVRKLNEVEMENLTDVPQG